MKKLTKILSALIVVAILMSSICINSSAAVSAPTFSNTGTRDEICLTLSDMAKSYYTGDYTYTVLSQKDEAQLLSSLRTFLTSTHTGKSNYANCRDYSYYTDCEKGAEANTVSLIYSSYTATKDQWNSGWNREHVWPKSLGGYTEDNTPGCDMHHVRPSDATINSTRNNNKYGNAEGGTPSKTAIATNTGGHLKNGYFEPLDNVKGDVARICLYVYVRYGGEYSKCNNITNVFESVDVLLEWCEMDPVDTWEMSRNDVVSSVQGNRNVFIDYPEYAWLLFGEEVPNSMETPSGEAKKAMPSEKPSDNENETTAPETNAPETNAPESDVADKETEVKEETKKETKKDNNNAADNSKKDSGCGSTIAISAICVVGIVGIMTIVKKKED